MRALPAFLYDEHTGYIIYIGETLSAGCRNITQIMTFCKFFYKNVPTV